MELDDKTREALKAALNNSPMYRYMQMEVVDAGEGRSRITLQGRKDLQNLYGILHGGAAATILDSACGIAVGSLLQPGEICVTIDLRINYIANVGEGVLTGEGHVVHRGRRTGVARAEVRDQEGNLIAAGMSTHLIYKPDESAKGQLPQVQD
jgi:uncharacterized protein (TIGR00369 family)